MNYFSEIIGHETQISRLKSDISSNNLSHAYLFSGPSGIGKQMIAKAFAKSLLVLSTKEEEQKVLQQIDNNTYADYIEIPFSEKIIDIELIRELIKKINISSSTNKKVLFLENIERMNPSSANAFLKVLEEPPKNTIILMSTVSNSLILETIVSRVRLIKIAPPNREISVSFLKEKFPERSVSEINEFFDISLERIGKAYSLLSGSEKANKHLKFKDELSSLIENGDIYDRFSFVENLLAKKDSAKENIRIFYEVLTYLMRENLIHGDEEKKRLGVKILSKISGDGILLKRNVNAKLLLQNIMLLI